MKQIKVSQERCIGCGACVAIDPEHFEFNEEGKSSVINQENIESENVLNAIESCPTSAIELVEIENEELNNEKECKSSECENECDQENCHCKHCHEENENA